MKNNINADNASPFGKRMFELCDYLIEKGFYRSVRDLCRHHGLSGGTNLYCLFSGEKDELQIKFVQSLAKAHNVSLDWLLIGEPFVFNLPYKNNEITGGTNKVLLHTIQLF